MLLFGMAVSAERLGGGKAKWTGGEDSKGYVCSRVKDTSADGYRNYTTVWVKNDKGQSPKNKSNTTGYNTSFEVTIKASHSKPLVAEKAWYENYWTKQVKGE